MKFIGNVLTIIGIFWGATFCMGPAFHYLMLATGGNFVFPFVALVFFPATVMISLPFVAFHEVGNGNWVPVLVACILYGGMALRKQDD